MPVNTQAGEPRRPPFDAEAARRLREALGMTPAHVAYGIGAAFGIRIPPATVVSWEDGLGTPTEAELTALAGALWCAPGELLGAPDTLRAYRMTRGLAPADLALRIGMDQAAYERLEAGGRWSGNDRQTAALAEVLDLPLPALIRFTGRDGKLTELLTSAATTRWQAYVRPVGKVVPLPKHRLQDVLQELHADYQATMTATLNWGGSGSADESGRAGRAFLDGILAEFWARAGTEQP
ncbi:helix-turn-helix transcriptional regulator [Streptomyces decoyicus]|uniref:Helix-turn-helix transcriptional regulator n=1 Tax=Streptomyces decoyicus TaxID=249567 RepID=A0ABZ1FFW2_9ACTN|nr:helix-turn-helix transcriptional regulator [Streptomyces decoyicus]WSB68897.1 helix-turn-helix transcriptional regulator [Streptomyces decoyicus]